MCSSVCMPIALLAIFYKFIEIIISVNIFVDFFSIKNDIILFSLSLFVIFKCLFIALVLSCSFGFAFKM